MSIWFSFLLLGEVITILLGDLPLHYFDSTWQVFLIIFCFPVPFGFTVPLAFGLDPDEYED